MTDNQQEGGQEILEGALPKPTFQEPSDDQQLSAAAAKGAQSSGLTAEQVAEIVKREIQGLKDQRVDKVYKGLGADPKQIVEAIKGGKDPDQVLADYQSQNLFERLDAIEQRFASPTPQTSQNGNAEQDAAFDKAVSLVTKAGLANDPDVQKLFQGQYKSPADFAYAVSELVLTRNTKTQPAAASVTMPAGGSKSSGNASTIQAQIDAIISDSKKAMSVDGLAELRTLAKQLEQLEAQ